MGDFPPGWVKSPEVNHNYACMLNVSFSGPNGYMQLTLLGYSESCWP